MRLIKVAAPERKGAKIIDLAFSSGIEKASKHLVEEYHSNAAVEKKDVVDIQTSTPKAKKFIDLLLKSDFYNKTDFSISTRQPRSIISSEHLSELTKPIAEPSIDILEELWQFSQITYSFVGRYFIAGSLLAYGLIQHQILIIIAGLLFLPVLPLLMSISFGIWMKQWGLLKQGVAASLTAVILLIVSGAFVASLCKPPIKYDEFNSPLAGLIISLAVGIAAALASIDDAGRRELIGLAATAQLAIIPVWFGICFVFGFPVTVEQNEIWHRGLMFFINFATIIVSSLAIYFCYGTARSSLEKI